MVEALSVEKAVKLRKLMFVLPNLFTLSSIFCGFYAITLCAGEASPSQLYQAALAIFFAIFFDGFDGRVARLTKTQTQFGIELDSLADVISFGVAPAMLVYKWALVPLGFVGMFISFAFTSCAALRLARFNVLAQKANGRNPSRFFVGLPTPLAAGTIVSMVVAHHGAKGGALGMRAHVPIAVVVAVLSLLMVSTVRYRTLKDVKVSPKSAAVFTLICIGGVIVATQFHPAYVLAAYFATYLALGLIESGVLLRNHLVSRKMAASTPSTGAVLEDDEDDEPSDVEEEDFL
jgi:CDP-diacylglycerol---serine O-phosphatidyltransferase